MNPSTKDQRLHAKTAQYIPPDLLARWERLSALADQKCRVGCIGLLKAGKSSLCNALTDSLDDRLFAVGVIRTTTSNQEHDCGDYLLLDTPGRASQRMMRLRANGSQLIAQECQNAIQRLSDSIDLEAGIDDAQAQTIIVECNNIITIGLQKLHEAFVAATFEDLEVILRSQMDDLPSNLADFVANQDVTGNENEARDNMISSLLRGANKKTLADSVFAQAKIVGRTFNNCSGWLQKILITIGKSAKSVAKCAGSIAVVVPGVASIFDITRGYLEDHASCNARLAQIHAVNQHLEHIQCSLRN